MESRAYFKQIIIVTTIPFLFFSRISEIFNLFDINGDIDKCMRIIAENQDNHISNELWNALVLAEDHRSDWHKGVDPIAMIRAIYVKLARNKFQEASTIEQQFVRVVSARYEKTFLRKFREQMLAISISRRASKYQIACSYLSIAFYGSGKIGLKGIEKISSTSFDIVNVEMAICIVARLKYPEPIKNKDIWLEKCEKRINHIAKLFDS